MTKPKTNDFLKSLEDGVQSVLEDKKATAAEKIAALKAGAAILSAKNKQKIEGDKSAGSFFAAKR